LMEDRIVVVEDRLFLFFVKVEDLLMGLDGLFFVFVEDISLGL